MKKFFLLNIFCLSHLAANMAPAGFERFPNYYFVGTGIVREHEIRLAKRAQFAEIHFMDNQVNDIIRARNTFAKESQIFIWGGDTKLMLYEVIKHMDKPITFWLDSGKSKPNIDGKYCWVLQELDQIKMHPIKTHTILIDDLHVVGTHLFDFITLEQIVKKIYEINPNYVITYIPGGDEGEYPNNILVAQVV